MNTTVIHPNADHCPILVVPRGNGGGWQITAGHTTLLLDADEAAELAAHITGRPTIQRYSRR